MSEVRLINANALYDTICKYSELKDRSWPTWIENLINAAPTIDAVEVVRCRECEYYKSKNYMTPGENRMRCNHPCLDYDEECFDHWLDVEPDDYCKYGKRKMDGGAADV